MKRGTRLQKGNVYKSNGAFYVRFRVTVDGDKRVMKSERLGSVDEISPKKADSLRARVMERVNATSGIPNAQGTLTAFVEGTYFPHAEQTLEHGTVHGYRSNWNVHFKQRVGHVSVANFRPVDGQRLLDSIHKEHGERLSHRTYSWMKTSMSAVFSHAIRLGLRDHNPMVAVSVRGMGKKHGRKTEAFSLEEVKKMLTIFKGQTAAIIATAAFQALRNGELRGLQAESFDGTNLCIAHSLGTDHELKGTKTGDDEITGVTVPCVVPVRKALEAINPGSGYMFRNTLGGPIDLSNLAIRVIKPELAKAGISWKGWYGFRRGTVSMLWELGVPVETASLILRNGAEVCRRHYLKLEKERNKREAIRKLDSALCDVNVM